MKFSVGNTTWSNALPILYYYRRSTKCFYGAFGDTLDGKRGQGPDAQAPRHQNQRFEDGLQLQKYGRIVRLYRRV